MKRSRQLAAIMFTDIQGYTALMQKNEEMAIQFSDAEIIGDGVNVASRIESLSVPGSVFISDKVCDEIKNQESIQTSMLRTFKLKNVERPIQVYAISNKVLIVPKPEEIEGKTDTDPAPLPEKQEQQRSKKRKRVNLAITISTIIIALLFVYLKFGVTLDSSSKNLENSIVVLAFENMSNDHDQEYFSDGISEEIFNLLPM